MLVSKPTLGTSPWDYLSNTWPIISLYLSTLSKLVGTNDYLSDAGSIMALTIPVHEITEKQD